MSITEVFRRVAGLIFVYFKAALSPGKFTFHGSLMVSPSIRVFIARNARVIIGRRVVICYGSDICAVENGVINISSGVYLGPRCMLSAHKEIKIGAGCLFGPDVKIFDNNHEFVPGRGVIKGRHRTEMVSIGENVWLGANVVILKGVDIGSGAVVGAGCVVRSNVPAGAVVRRENELEAEI